MSRETETRATATREAATRNSFDFDSLRDLPPELLDADKDYRWVNEEVRGERQRTNLFTRLNRDGFVPVSTSDIPALAMTTLEEDRPANELVRHGGQILMSRPKERDVQDRGEMVRQARQAEADARKTDVTDKLGQDPRQMRAGPEKTRVTRGRPAPQFDD